MQALNFIKRGCSPWLIVIRNGRDKQWISSENIKNPERKYEK